MFVSFVSRAKRTPIPVGRHRIQMDIQQLPAVQGGTGFEYKITAIHLRTRLKYTEIHADRKSATVAGPLFLIWTDNAYEFTMRFSAHPERKSAFERLAEEMGLIHGKCEPGRPWQNGIVERSPIGLTTKNCSMCA